MHRLSMTRRSPIAEGCSGVLCMVSRRRPSLTGGGLKKKHAGALLKEEEVSLR